MPLLTTRSMHRQRFSTLFYVFVVILSVLPLSAAGTTVAATQPATPSPSPVTDDPLYAAVKPDERSTVASETAGELSTYIIAAELRMPAGGQPPQIVGTLALDYRNTTGDALSRLPFRLFANGRDVASAVVITDARVAGAAVEPALSEADTIATFPLATPLAPEATVRIDLAFTSTVPVSSESSYGIYNVDPESGTWSLAYWYPVVAGFDPATGFLLAPTSRNGDPIFSSTALYDVTLTAPSGWRLVTTGIAVEEADDGRSVTRRIVSGPVRDFTIVADADFVSATQEVDGTTITSWFDPGDERTGEAVATYAAQALELFNDLFGAYPYVELDLTANQLNGAAGVEFPQLIYIGASYYEPNRTFPVPNGLDFTVAHEVAHQWWYGLVGNNQYQHAFIDEGLTQWVSCAVYFDRVYDEEAADRATSNYLVDPFETAVRIGADQVVDTPTDEFDSEGDYVLAVYSKAPLGFAAVHETIGDEAFFAALSDYYATFRFDVAQPADLLAAFETTSGQELDELWRHWFEAAEGEDDLGAIPQLP